MDNTNNFVFTQLRMEKERIQELHHWGAYKKTMDFSNRGNKRPETFRSVEKRRKLENPRSFRSSRKREAEENLTKTKLNFMVHIETLNQKNWLIRNCYKRRYVYAKIKKNQPPNFFLQFSLKLPNALVYYL